MLQLHRIALKFLFLAILIVLVSPSSAISSSDFKAEFVTYVHSYDKYIPRWSNVYTQGEKIELYVAVKDVNVLRAVAVDFVVIIKDPKGYVVAGKVIQKRVVGYEDDIYDVFKIPVEKGWIDGKYKLDVYAFDVLNFTGTFASYSKLYETILYSGKYSPSVSTISRESAPYVKKEIEFVVEPKATLPSDRFLIFNSHLKARELPEGASNSLMIGVLNRIDQKGVIELEARVDGERVDRKEVELDGYESKEISFEIPSLPLGEHRIEVVATPNVKYSKTPPIFISPLLYVRDVLVGEFHNGSIVYSPNNYVLGSVGISEIKDVDLSKSIADLKSNYNMNKESSKLMLTNILAYLWQKYNGKGTINVALLEGSDKRAEKVLPVLLDLIKDESDAPINYLGIRDYNNLKGISVVFYVGNKAPEIGKFVYFFENGGLLIVDDTTYWSTLKDDLLEKLSIRGWKGFKKPDALFTSYYDLNINKSVTISLKSELKILPEFVYSDLRVDKFIARTGEVVEIKFKVKNEGGAGKKEVVLLVNEEPIFKEDIELDTGEEKDISIQYIPKEEGSYKVEVGNIVKVFFVKSVIPETIKTPQEKVERKGGEFIVGSAMLLAILVIVRMFMR